MEAVAKHSHGHHHQLNSPTSTTSSSNSNAVQQQQQQQPCLTPKPQTPTTRSEPASPYPTTFVQADTSSFKQVVQMLTGSSETAKQAADPNPNPNPRSHIPPVKPKSGFKLYERRSSLKNLKINPLMPVFAAGSGFSPRQQPDVLSPSVLDFPSLVLSPVTPLIPDPFDRAATAGSGQGIDREAEERAIKEKGFYLHPSPRESDPPRLLPLFPTTSPRISSGSSSLSS